jgi:acyl-CoA dehydrogenase
LDFILTEEQQDIRAAVRELCQSYPDAYWRAKDKEGAYPTEFVQALTEAGWLGALIPEEFGGAGLGFTEAGVILEEIARSGGNPTAAHAQMYTMGTVLRHGSDEQKRRYLPDVASGELRLQAFGVTEPNAGSNTTQIETRAERKGDTYVVNGQKVFISRAQYTDLMLLLARTAPYDEAHRTRGLSVFLVDLKGAVEKGQLEIRPLDLMINHHTPSSSSPTWRCRSRI